MSAGTPRVAFVAVDVCRASLATARRPDQTVEPRLGTRVPLAETVTRAPDQAAVASPEWACRAVTLPLRPGPGPRAAARDPTTRGGRGRRPDGPAADPGGAPTPGTPRRGGRRAPGRPGCRHTARSAAGYSRHTPQGRPPLRPEHVKRPDRPATISTATRRTRADQTTRGLVLGQTPSTTSRAPDRQIPRQPRVPCPLTRVMQALPRTDRPADTSVVDRVRVVPQDDRLSLIHISEPTRPCH
jgi:hypothetical protein